MARDKKDGSASAAAPSITPAALIPGMGHLATAVAPQQRSGARV